MKANKERLAPVGMEVNSIPSVYKVQQPPEPIYRYMYIYKYMDIYTNIYSRQTWKKETCLLKVIFPTRFVVLCLFSLNDL